MSKMGFLNTSDNSTRTSQKEDTIFTFDSGYTLSQEDAKLHTLILGTTGTGKTASIFLPMLYGVMCAGECGLIVDIKGNLREQVRSLAKACDRDKDIFEFGLSDTAIPCNIIDNMSSNELYNLLEMLVDHSYDGRTHNKDFHVRGVMKCVKIYELLCIYFKKKNSLPPTLKDIFNLISNPLKAVEVYEDYKQKLYDENNAEEKALIQEIEADAFSVFAYSKHNRDRETYFRQLDYAIAAPRTALEEAFGVKNFERNFACKGAPGISIRNNFYKNRIVILRFSPGSGKVGSMFSRYYITKYYETVFDMEPKDIFNYPSFICIDEFHDVATLNSRTRFSDTAFVAQAREFRASFIASTQSASSLLCNNNDINSVTAFIANCNTRVYFRTDDPMTQEIVMPYNEDLKLLDLEHRQVYFTSYSNIDEGLICRTDTVNKSFNKVRKILLNPAFVQDKENILKTNDLLLKTLCREQKRALIEEEELNKIATTNKIEEASCIKIYDKNDRFECKGQVEFLVGKYKKYLDGSRIRKTYIPLSWQEPLQKAFEIFYEDGKDFSIQDIVYDEEHNCIKLIAFEEFEESENLKLKELEQAFNALIVETFQDFRK